MQSTGNGKKEVTGANVLVAIFRREGLARGLRLLPAGRVDPARCRELHRPICGIKKSDLAGDPLVGWSRSSSSSSEGEKEEGEGKGSPRDDHHRRRKRRWRRPPKWCRRRHHSAIPGDAIEGGCARRRQGHGRFGAADRHTAAAVRGAVRFAVRRRNDRQLRGTGRGGRNVEFLLSLGVSLDGLPGVHALAGDTDGVDGVEEIAGAYLAPDSLGARLGERNTAQGCVGQQRRTWIFQCVGRFAYHRADTDQRQ